MADIKKQIANNLTMIRAMVSQAVDLSSTYLDILWRRTFTWQIRVGQSEGAFDARPPGIDPLRPTRPAIPLPDIAPMGSYSTDFVMPSPGRIDDKSRAPNRLIFDEPEYSEWMLTELRSRIRDGFDRIATSVATQNGIWARLLERHTTALIESIDRRTKRWAGRGYDVPSEILNFRREEVIRRFGYAYSDYERDWDIKIAELRVDNRQFSIGAALKGEAMIINQSEEMAMRSLDVAKTMLELNIKAFEADMDRWADVIVEEWRNKLYYFTKDVLMKIEKSKADIARYITNTRIIAEKTKTLGLGFEMDTEAYIADAFLNELQAETNIEVNELRLHEMEENLDLRIRQIAANTEARLKTINTDVEFMDNMGKVYAEYLRAAMEAITSLTHIASDYTKTLTLPLIH